MKEHSELQQAVLDFFNNQDIHPYTNSDIENLWRAAKIKVNKKKNGWVFDSEEISHKGAR